MFKGIIIFILTVFCVSNVYASTVYDYPASADSVAKNLPELNSTSCKFSQEKSFKNTTLKSGGNFQFIKDKGVIFETLYPVKSTTSYKNSSLITRRTNSLASIMLSANSMYKNSG